MWILNISSNLLILVVLTTIRTQADSTACETKEKHHAALDLAKELISKAKDLQPSCDSDSKDVSTNSSECGAKGKVSAYLDFARNLIDDAKKTYSTCDDINVDNSKKNNTDDSNNDITDNGNNNNTKVVLLHEKPIDCSEILENGEVKSGQYEIFPRNSISNGAALKVYCDMDTDGGGWTVIQRRGDFSNKIDFKRDWNSYKNGFGSLSEEFWIGNDNIFALTNQGDYTARFDMQNNNKEYKFATYSSFRIEDEKASYKLHFDKYFGTAGDGINKINNRKFSTHDRENNRARCAATRKGGWWFNFCGDSNPNGINRPGGGKADRNKKKFMNWHPWTTYDSLLKIEIKIRQKKNEHLKGIS